MRGAERLVIVNADDLGLSRGVTRGILELARLGAVTSASALVTMPGAPAALEEARAAGLDVGVHLNLCAGMPLLPAGRVPTLVRPDGRFPAAGTVTRRLLAGRVRPGEVEREWATQIERALAHGVRPSHLDSHCHLHALPLLYRLTLRLARRYGIPGVRPAYAGYVFQPPRLHRVRVTMAFPPRDSGVFRPDRFTVLTVLAPIQSPRPLTALLRALPPGVTELVCHPGYVDDELRARDPLTTPRERERLVLSRSHLRDTLAAEGIRAVSWAEASRGRG